MKKEKNVLFIIVDALRARNLSCYGYPKPTSPDIDKLAKEGILFEDAYSNSNITDSSFTTIFSGKYPISHGITTHGERIQNEHIKKLDESSTVFLPEILKSKGYNTLAVDWLGRWHKRGYDFYWGGETLHLKYLDKIPLFLHKLLSLLESFIHKKVYDKANNVTDKALDLLKKIHDKKFFLLIHYMDLHFPYRPPINYSNIFYHQEEKFSTIQNMKEILDQIHVRKYKTFIQQWTRDVKDVNHLLAQYDGAIAFVDNEIGRLIEALDKYGILQDTLIILTSDHGESLMEHGIFFDHHGLYDETIHVPLIIRGHELPPKKIKGFIQHVDLVPTILDILGFESDKFDFDGSSALPLIDGEINQLRSVVYCEENYKEQKRAIKTRQYKYIYALSEKDAICRSCGRIHGGIEELYDLNKDPGETKNIVEDNPEIADKLKKRLSKWIKMLENKKRRKRILKRKKEEEKYTRKEEKRIKERLKALGYFD